MLTPLIPIASGKKGPPYIKDWPNASLDVLEEAMKMHPGCNLGLRLDRFLALDPDNQKAATFLTQLEKKGKLPPTVSWLTWRGMQIRLYRRPPDFSPLKIIHQGMNLELRTGVGQYVLVPDSKVKTGQYKWAPHLSPADVDEAEPPSETLDLLKKLAGNGAGPRTETRKQSEEIPKGRRNETLTSIAGSLRRRGMTQDEIAAILLVVNQRCVPPLSEKEVRRIAQGVARYQPEEIVVNKDQSLIFPPEVLSGIAGRFAKTYAQYLEVSEPFLFMGYLTLLGHIFSDRITLDSEIHPQPRLFTIFLGESADTRKSTAINKVTQFFREMISEDDLTLIWGVGSAEGLAKAFAAKKKILLVQDELKSLVQKCRIDGSVLLPCINTLFEGNRFQSLTKSHDIKIEEAQLCLLGASTLDTYQNMFAPQFLDIGFPNRLFIVISDNQRRFAVPPVMPEEVRESLRQDLRQLLRHVGVLSNGGLYAMPIDPQAMKIFSTWYFDLEKTVFAKRLDTYGHRLLSLVALNELKDRVTSDIASKVVALLRYELEARRQADPIEADNAIAKVEERIRRVLSGGPLSKRELERRCHKNRIGTWAWNTAIRNLTSEGEVIFDRKTGAYALANCHQGCHQSGGDK